MKSCPQCQVKYPDALEFCPRDGFPLPMAPGASSDKSDPIIGTTIDSRYAIEARLGEGGMGVVYKAKHVLIDKPVAIKILRREAAQDQASVQRFIQEAKSASKIGHSNIVDITDFGVLPDGHAYFVMEFLQGPTLAQALQDGPLEPVRVCHIAAQMARGLHAAHQKGIVHRDLKPENIFLLEREGQKDFVKVVDFGIAKVGSGQRLTQVGMVLGTPEYMSPEQATGQETDHRVDQYALGCMMYEMLTGVVPFLGERPAQTLTKHVFEPVIPPRQRKPELNIPASLEAVVMRTLAKKASERFPSMRELELALQQVEAELRSGRVVVDDARLYTSGRHAVPGTATEPAVPAVAPTQSYPQPAYPQAPYPASSQGSTPLALGAAPATGTVATPYTAPPYGAYPSMASVPPGTAAPVPMVPVPLSPIGGAPAYPVGPAVSGAQGVAPFGAPYPSGAVAAYERASPTRETATTQQTRRRRSLLAAGVGAVLVLMVLGVYLLVLDRPPSAPPEPGPMPPAPASQDVPVIVRPSPPPPQPRPAPPPAAPERIQTRVVSSPSGANVYVNGERVGQTPVVITETRGVSFQLEVRKGGYRPSQREVVAGDSEEVQVNLQRRSEGSRSKRGRAEVQAPPPAPPASRDGLRNPFGPKK